VHIAHLRTSSNEPQRESDAGREGKGREGKGREGKDSKETAEYRRVHFALSTISPYGRRKYEVDDYRHWFSGSNKL
jgi:hypothetical protein